MAKTISGKMNYYETLVTKINQSMKKHPRSAMAMDMGSFAIIAKGADLQALGRKMPAPKAGSRSLVFQKPSEKVTWIL